jgi:diaminopimelate epimerase
MPASQGPRLPFFKYQGTGNDFILLDWTRTDLPDHQTISRLCDRRTGIGADGLLLLTPPAEMPATARMILFNPDGSRPEMCGNGLRCAAMHVAFCLRAKTAPIVIATDAGPRTCELLTTGNPSRVRVDMGRVSLPLDLALAAPAAHLKTLSVGNPHAVVLDDVPEDAIGCLGAAIATHPRFPQGVNVGFPRNVQDQSFQLTVFERGAGLTRACGTGACAATVALFSAGRLKTTRDVRVQLPGGELCVDHDPDTGNTWLTGDAYRVFEGLVAWPTGT